MENTRSSDQLPMRRPQRARIRRLQLRHLVFFLLLMVAWMVFAAAIEAVVLLVGVLVVLITVVIFPSLYVEVVSLSPVRRLLRLTAFVLYILPALLVASSRLASLAVRPSVATCSRILRYDYAIRDRLGLLLLSISITLTPGTLVLDIEPDRSILYIHNLDREGVSETQTLASVRAIEDRLLRVFA